MRLRLKLFLPLIIFILLFVSYAKWFWLPKLSEFTTSQNRTHYHNHLKSIGESLVPLILQQQLANIHETLNSLKDSNTSWKQLQLHNHNKKLLFPIETNRVLKPSKSTLHISHPIKITNREIATLSIVVDISPELAQIKLLEKSLFLALLVLLIWVVFTIAGLIEWIISHPIRHLAKAAKNLADGNYSTKLPKANKDEVGYLVNSFEAMRDALKKYKTRVELEIIGHKHTANELNIQKERLAYYATHDSLTGLLNRREFEIRLNAAIERAHKDSVVHAVFYLDLDRFKLVNDSCGHIAGDELLKQISTLLTNQVRESDSPARLGGDEFAILLEYCPVDIATKTVANLHYQIQNHVFSWNEKSFNVGASIGVAFITKHTENLQSILLAADSACYTAKHSGRNRYYIDGIDDAVINSNSLKAESVSMLLHAIKNDLFELQVQIIKATGAKSNARQSYEILIRMRDMEDKLIKPDVFIPIAEKYHLMTQIDRWVIEKTFRTLEYINEIGVENISFSINLSGVSMSDDAILPFIREQLQIRNINPNNICFEVTETAAISDIENAKLLINELKDLGCEFALDDFGSGFSSFDYLKNLKMDYLKIDGSFVRDILDDPIYAAMVQSIHDIGKVLGMQTIAEFVENDTILQRVTEIGVDFVQGYALAKPIPLTSLIHELKTNNIKKKSIIISK